MVTHGSAPHLSYLLHAGPSIPRCWTVGRTAPLPTSRDCGLAKIHHNHIFIESFYQIQGLCTAAPGIAGSLGSDGGSSTALSLLWGSPGLTTPSEGPEQKHEMSGGRVFRSGSRLCSMALEGRDPFLFKTVLSCALSHIVYL